MLKPYKFRVKFCTYCRSTLGKVIYACQDGKFACCEYCRDQHNRKNRKLPMLTDDVDPKQR